MNEAHGIETTKNEQNKARRGDDGGGNGHHGHGGRGPSGCTATAKTGGGVGRDEVYGGCRWSCCVSGVRHLTRAAETAV